MQDDVQGLGLRLAGRQRLLLALQLRLQLLQHGRQAAVVLPAPESTSQNPLRRHCSRCTQALAQEEQEAAHCTAPPWPSLDRRPVASSAFRYSAAAALLSAKRRASTRSTTSPLCPASFSAAASAANLRHMGGFGRVCAAGVIVSHSTVPRTCPRCPGPCAQQGACP